MKAYKFIKSFTFGILLSHWPLAVQALDSGRWIVEIRNMELPEVSDGNLDFSAPASDVEVLEKFRFGDLKSQEGIPTGHEFREDINHTGYGPADHLKQILEGVGEWDHQQFVFSVPIGSAIQTLSASAQEWTLSSGQSPLEVMPRVMLNRCLDFYQLMLPVAGQNSDEVRRFFANYWEKCYTNAISYANNNVVVASSSTFKDLPERVKFYVDRFREVSPPAVLDVHVKSMVEFAYEQAQFFYKNTASIGVSEEAQAVGLVRLLGYLGYDHNADLNARHPDIRKTVTDVRRIQKSSEYQAIISAFAEGQAFAPAQKQKIRLLRVQVSRLLMELPARLERLKKLSMY